MKHLVKISVFCLIGLLVIAIARYAYVKTQYPKLLTRIEQKRTILARKYQSAQSAAEKERIVSQAREYLHNILSNEVLPAWYCTPWAFNGNAKFPLEGRIACGAFVENVLRHCGFVLDRRLSAQPSEYIIKNLVGNKRDMRRFSNVSIDRFMAEVGQMGEGVYIIGLDSHVGFLYKLNGKYRFVHSHGYLFVLSEFPSISPTIRRSRYRVVGKLFDRLMIEKWLFGKRFYLKYDYFRNKKAKMHNR